MPADTDLRGLQLTAGGKTRDGRDDYLVVDPKTSELTACLNDGEVESHPYNWQWKPVGSIASGLGPGRNVRFADLDGDGGRCFQKLEESWSMVN